MDGPNDQKKAPPTDKEIKDAARNGRSGASRPGVVSMNEAAALDQRIAEKNRSAMKPPAAALQDLNQLERDVSSKQKNAPAFAAATPGAYSSQSSAPSLHTELSNLESDVAAKQRARPPNASAVEGLDQKVAAKMAASSRSAAVGNRELDDLEASVQAKVSTYTREGSSTPQQYGHSSTDAKPAARDDLSRLDERIAAKNASDVPRSLQEKEDVATKKKTNGAKLGDKDAAQNDKSPPEQSPEQRKVDGWDTHPQGLQPHGDVEYGEFGGPTEQGLAVAFAVEEETEDAFIPAAIEYDPDAKPPLIKNRRFRLYAFLVVIAVFIATISAAVGLTLAGKKIEYDDVTRLTLGIRETVESLVGVEKLVDPTSPHSKALDWIQYRDPLQLVPSHPHFIQRYILALFYYSTSVKREWIAGCAPAVGNETDDCDLELVFRVGDPKNPIFPSKRWLSGLTECDWAGVKCTGEHKGDVRHVRSIELWGKNMTGTIPDELHHLYLLQKLSIRFNEFGGTLPKMLSEFRHLVYLDLHKNEFTGSIPTSFFSNPVLHHLEMSGNYLNGTLPTSIGQMMDAKELYLGRNQFSGSIPTELGRLHSIYLLDLGSNRFSSTIPTEIGTMGELEQLTLYENQLTGAIPSTIGSMTKLADLKLFQNRLQGQIPSGLYDVTTLVILDLKDNLFSGSISTAIGKLVKLDNLVLHTNSFTGTLPSTLATLTDLDNIQFQGTMMNGTVTSDLCEGARLARSQDPITKFFANCLGDDDGTPPEVLCECCTMCCDRNGLCPFST